MGEIISQEGFNEYMRMLPMKDGCQFMIYRGMNLCNKEDFICPYRGKEKYSLRVGTRRECKRKRINELKKILGSAKKTLHQSL